MRILQPLMASIVFALFTGSSTAQDRAPEKPEGVMLTAADHQQNVSQLTVYDFHNPAAGLEGFQTYWPDGAVVMS